MKTTTIYILTISFLFILFSCNSKKRSGSTGIDEATYRKYVQKGNEISNLAQGVLLAHVGKAIQKGGAEYAVGFCNSRASSIIDSLNRISGVSISRISEKNRNPENNLKNNREKQLWKAFTAEIKPGAAKDTLLKINNKLIYYKPIKTVAPTCLKCHGTPGDNIETATLEKLQTLYPKDRATGYGLNDFRGLWKIEFSE